MIDTPLPRITEWAQVQKLKDDGKLSPAELKLLEKAAIGEEAEISDTVPTEPSEATLIRAPLISYMILGGCEEFKTQAAGIELQGAWIGGKLDLEYSETVGPIRLIACNFPSRLEMSQCQTPMLDLDGSKLAEGLEAECARVAGHVLLRNINAKGQINLLGATIGGQLVCKYATMENTEDDALNAQNAQIGDHVILEKVAMKGTPNLSEATIAGQLNCSGATFDGAPGEALNAQGAEIGSDVFLLDVIAKGQVSLLGATIAGQLECNRAELDNGDGIALQMQRAVVKRGFHWWKVASVVGDVDLNSAEVGDLLDDAESWEKCDGISLPGLTYDVVHGSVDVRSRLAWLEKGAIWAGEFHPQPYQQLAKVLHESGHRTEANQILFEKEVAQRKATRAGLIDGNKALLWPLHLIWDWALRLTVGYGLKPQRSFYGLAFLMGLGWYVADQTWKAGDFAPNSDIILGSENWQSLATDDAIANPAQVWSDRYATLPTDNDPGQYAKGRDYETFNAGFYAIDTVVPIISLGQEAAWSPSTNRGVWGQRMWRLGYWLTILGWVVTAIGAAAITGVVRRE